MGQEEIISSMLQELRRGTLVLCVLKELETPMYGYNLIGTMEEKGIRLEANTLYPLMRRLEAQGLLVSEWETGGSKPRKYYRITDEGREVCARMEQAWRDTVASMNRFLEHKEDEQ